MTTCIGQSCSFALLCISFMKVYQFVCARASFPFGFEGGIWNLFTGILVPDYCTARQC